MDGWIGSILRVNLTRGDYTVEDLDYDLVEQYLGGRGLASKYLLDEIDPMVDPLSPENKLIIATGPLTGTNIPATGRTMVVTKSPLTGAIACANFGGYFGPEMKFAGYDMIIFEGKSPEPVYVSIVDDQVEFKPAKHIWGKRTTETDEIIKSEMEDEWKGRETQTIRIGPAGENLVKIASVIYSGGAAARSGVGAAMGSKNLKAVAIRGTKAITIADMDGFKEAVRAAWDKIMAEKSSERALSHGTWDLIFLAKRMGAMASFNSQAGGLEELGEFDGRHVKRAIYVKSKSCFGCGRGCFNASRVSDPEFESDGYGPEFEGYDELGPQCGIVNISAITKACHLCDELGMDTISMGVTVACAMELYERGFLPEKDAGYQLNFGNDKAMVELVEKTGLRQDFGDALAEGAYRLAEKYGHPEYFMGAKKQEIPAWHPQYHPTTGLAYATANCGACHTRSCLNVFEVRKETEGMAAKVKEDQDYFTAIDSMGGCWSLYMTNSEDFGDMVTLLSLVTGVDYTEESLRKAGERIWNLERQFILAAGYTGADDTLPKRLLEEPCLKGDAEGLVVRLDEMLPEYYELRGWDKNGVPTPEKLKELGLD